MRRTVTAVIPHYWESRVKDLPRIVDALCSGEVAPERVIIWDNTGWVVRCDDADVINAGRNWGTTARFAAAYLARTEFVFFQDNDLMVQPGTIANMLNATCGVPGVSVELQGRKIGQARAPYTTSSYLTNVDQVVDIGLSRMSLMTRGTAMDLAGKIPPEAVDDDIWTSRNCTVRLVSYPANAGWIDLPETEGLSKDAAAHVRRRDELVRELWRL